MNTYLLYTLVFVLFFYFIIHPIINYLNWINWWYSNNKIGSTEGFNCLDLISYAFANQNYITYKLYNMFNSLSGQVIDVQIQFVTMLLEVYSTQVGGFMLPYHLCKSLVPLQPLQGRAWPTNDDGWKALIKQWAGISPQLVINDYSDYSNAVNNETWITDPTNFLYQQWGIPALSPIVVAFVTGFTGDGTSNVQLYSQMMHDLLIPGPDGRGGWIPFINNAGSIFGDKDLGSIDTVYRSIWQTLQNVPQKVQNHKAPGCSTGQIVSSISQGLMVGLMTAVMVPPPLGILAGIAIGAGTAIGPLLSCRAPSQN